MGKIYVGQTKLDIELTVGQDISEAQSVHIRYRKPSSPIVPDNDHPLGSWVAEIVDGPTGVIRYSIASAETLSESGRWVLWAHVKFADGREAPGEPVIMIVNKEGLAD